MTQQLTLEEQTVQSPVVPTIDFYLERFKKSVSTFAYYKNGRLVDEDVVGEIYKGFAIITWKQEYGTPQQGVTQSKCSSYVWEVGGAYDQLLNLGWISQGVVSTAWGSPTIEEAIKKIRKKVDLLSTMYCYKTELQGLSKDWQPRLTTNDECVYNATIGDVVAIRAFNRVRLGKIVKTTGSRFVVAYMTPSNPHDIHYKTLPLSNIYPRKVN